MHNYLKKLKLCRENYATRKINFAEKTPESFALCEKIFLCDITWNLAVFFRLINIHKLLSQGFSVSCNSSHPDQKKSKVKLEKKTTETALEYMSLVLRNYAKFTRKHLCQSVFLIMLHRPPASEKFAVNGRYVLTIIRCLKYKAFSRMT